jgi:DNA-binding CsgD family transcriptional regulator
MAATALGEFAAAGRHFYAALKLAVQIQLVSLIFSLFLHIGLLFLRTRQEARGLALLALTRDHPAATPAFRQEAAQQLEQVQPPASGWSQAAEVPWRALDSVETVAASLLVELAQYTVGAPDVPVTLPVAPPVASPKPTPAADGLIEPLTERELEILRLLAQGLTNEEIANELVVAVGTVKSHNHSIFSKLGVNNRTGAVSRARQLHLL